MNSLSSLSFPSSGSFRLPILVMPEDIDELGHVNNVTWVRWLQDAALAHSTALGWDLPAYQRAGVVFVVRRHEIDYLAPAFSGDRLIAHTWVENMERSTSVRRVFFVKEGTDRAVVRAATTWATMTLAGRPCRVPDELRDAFPVAEWEGGDGGDARLPA